MTNRPDIEELLCDYVDGSLDAAGRQQVEAILAQDAELRKTVQQMMLGRDALKALPIEKTPSHVAGEIRQALVRPTPHRWTFSLGRMAAALLVTFALAAIIWSMLPSPRQSPVASATPYTPEIDSVVLKSTVDAERAFPAPAAVSAPAAPEAPARADQPTYAAANATALMYVRASDIPAVEREITRLVTSNQIRHIVSNSSADRLAPAEAKQDARRLNDSLQKDEKIEARDAGAAGRPAGMGGPSAMKAEKEAFASKPLAAEATLERQKTRGQSGAGGSLASAPEIHLPDVTTEQLLQIQQNVIALSPSNRVEILPAQPATQQSQAQFQMQSQAQPRAELQQQMLRSMPSASQQDLQQFAQLREQQQRSRQTQAAAPERYDVTIIIQPEQLPPARPAATLPATLPQR